MLLGEDILATARVDSLAGAFVGLADDANAISTNPAGLAAIPRSIDAALAVGEGRFNGVERWAFPSQFAAALRPWRRVAVGLEIYRVRHTLDTNLEVTRNEAGPDNIRALLGNLPSLGLAAELPGGFCLGVSAQFTGVWARFRANAEDDPSQELKGPQLTDRNTSWTFGGLWRLETGRDRGFRVGIAFRPQTEWQPRSSGSPGPPANLQLPLVLSSARVLSAGASFHFLVGHAGKQMTASLQWDRYSWPEPLDVLASPLDKNVFRAGVEYSWPLRCFSGCGTLIQLRGGFQSGVLTTAIVPASGPSRVLGHGDRAWSFGLAGALSAVLRGRLRVDLGARLRGSERSVNVGIAFRYPDPLRGSLRYRRPPPTGRR